MKRLLFAALLLCLSATGQAITANSIVTNTLSIVAAGAPTPVTVTLLQSQPGTATYYYWVVSTNSVGSTLAGPFPIVNAPATLSTTANVAAFWIPSSGTDYSLLRTATTAPPAGACNCAVSIAAPASYITDTGTLLAYTVPSLLAPSSFGPGPAITPTSIEGVEYADQYAGADIGAKVNAAIAALHGGCGTVRIPAGAYSFSTTIIKPRCVWIAGDAPGTVMTYTPTSGTAIAIGDSGSGTAYLRGGLKRLKVIGSGSAIGLWLGGDPAGIVLPSGDFGDGQVIISLQLQGFGTAIEWGNNAWLESFYSIELNNGATGITAAGGALNSSENNAFFGGGIFNMSGAAVAATEGQEFVGVSFDFNGAPSAGGLYTACHFEQQSGVFISGISATISGGDAVLDSTTGSDGAMFKATGTNPQWSIRGLSVFSGHSVTNLVDWSGASGADASLRISGLYGNGNHEIGAITNAASAFGIYVINNLAGLSASPSTIGGLTDLGAGRVRNSGEAGNWNLDLFDDNNGGDGTPHKFLRTNSGSLQVLNNAFSSVVLQLTDAGALSWGGGQQIASSSGVVLTGANGVSAGTITITSGTSGAHTFATAYAAIPFCTASLESAPPATAISFSIVATTTGVTITSATSITDTFSWVCVPAAN